MATEATLLDRIRMLENRVEYLEAGQAVGITGTDQTVKGSHDRLDAIFGAGSTPSVDADNLEVTGGKLQFSAAAAGNGLTGGAGAALAVNVGTGLEINSDAVRIAAAAAGDGLTGGGGSALAVNAGTGLEISGDTVRIAAAAAGNGLTGGAGSALAVNTGTGLEISGDAVRIAAAAAGDGLTGGAGSALAVNVGAGLEINADAVRIAAAAAGDGLTGGAGSALAVNCDGTTIETSGDAIRIKGLTRKCFIPATRGYVANTSAPLHGADERGFLCDDAIDTYVVGNWYLPVDYSASLTIVACVQVSGTTGSWYGANVVYCGAANQDHDTHSDTSGYAQVASAEEQKEAQSVSVSSVAAGDYVTCVFHRDGNHASDTGTAMAVYVKGWMASYTATR